MNDECLADYKASLALLCLSGYLTKSALFCIEKAARLSWPPSIHLANTGDCP